MFLVGNSLGANLITKYLGEEGLSGTLPKCVKGGVSLANPLHIHSKNNNHTPMSHLMAWGVKLAMLEQWRTWKQTLVYPQFRDSLLAILRASTIDQVDEAMRPVILRNESHYPFRLHIGYDSVEDYWKDCSSYRMSQHISVPLLQIIAGDDPVVYHAFQRKLAHCGRNPNIMSCETKCGGHLGWQESSPVDQDGFRPSWAGRATADFIDAILAVGPLQSQTSAAKQEMEQNVVQAAAWESPPMPDDKWNKGKDLPILRSRL